jgi:hypothetical protein
VVVGTNISATPASKTSSGRFKPGGTVLNMMRCAAADDPRAVAVDRGPQQAAAPK